MCDVLLNFDDLFFGLHEFSQSLWFPSGMSPNKVSICCEFRHGTWVLEKNAEGPIHEIMH
jgi:hypothetical protein